jgi:hypothetical protein
MGRIDGTSRDNGRPAGVTDAFQVRLHSVEPILSNRCRNLFSHEDRGPTGADKLKEDGPEVALVFLRFAFPGNGEGLAGGAACPQRPFVGPASKAGGVGPAANPGEEVALGVSAQVLWSHVANRPFIYIPLRYQPLGYQVAQPLGCVGVNFVIVRAHSSIPSVVHRHA